MKSDNRIENQPAGTDSCCSDTANYPLLFPLDLTDKRPELDGDMSHAAHNIFERQISSYK